MIKLKITIIKQCLIFERKIKLILDEKFLSIYFFIWEEFFNRIH